MALCPDLMRRIYLCGKQWRLWLSQEIRSRLHTEIVEKSCCKGCCLEIAGYDDVGVFANAERQLEAGADDDAGELLAVLARA